MCSQYQKAFHHDPKLLPAQKVLEMITIEPAQMLGLNAGSLEEGKDADIVLVDLRRPNMTPTRVTNVIENLIWASDGSEIQYVIANGKVLKDNYTFTTIDATQALAEVQALGEQFDEYKQRIGQLKGWEPTNKTNTLQ